MYFDPPFFPARIISRSSVSARIVCLLVGTAFVAPQFVAANPKSHGKDGSRHSESKNQPVPVTVVNPSLAVTVQNDVATRAADNPAFQPFADEVTLQKGQGMAPSAIT